MDETVDGARTFRGGGDEYDRWMGRYSRELARPFAASVRLADDATALDAGCGPGALTTELVRLLGAANVSAFDPAPAFAAACAERHPGVDVRIGAAEAIPFGDAVCDTVLAQLVLSFVSDPAATAAEFRRVLRPGGVAAACVWDYAGGMELLRRFWDAALELDPDAPDEARVARFGRSGEIAELFEASGLVDVSESRLEVVSRYADFDELWGTVLLGVGPAGAYCLSLAPERREELRTALLRGFGSPAGAFDVHAIANSATGRNPD